MFCWRRYAQFTTATLVLLGTSSVPAVEAARRCDPHRHMCPQATATEPSTGWIRTGRAFGFRLELPDGAHDGRVLVVAEPPGVVPVLACARPGGPAQSCRIADLPDGLPDGRWVNVYVEAPLTIPEVVLTAVAAIRTADGAWTGRTARAVVTAHEPGSALAKPRAPKPDPPASDDELPASVAGDEALPRPVAEGAAGSGAVSEASGDGGPSGHVSGGAASGSSAHVSGADDVRPRVDPGDRLRWLALSKGLSVDPEFFADGEVETGPGSDEVEPEPVDRASPELAPGYWEPAVRPGPGRERRERAVRPEAGGGERDRRRPGDRKPGKQGEKGEKGKAPEGVAAPAVPGGPGGAGGLPGDAGFAGLDEVPPLMPPPANAGTQPPVQAEPPMTSLPAPSAVPEPTPSMSAAPLPRQLSTAGVRVETDEEGGPFTGARGLPAVTAAVMVLLGLLWTQVTVQRRRARRAAQTML